jgi:hypothetical protein
MEGYSLVRICLTTVFTKLHGSAGTSPSQFGFALPNSEP